MLQGFDIEYRLSFQAVYFLDYKNSWFKKLNRFGEEECKQLILSISAFCQCPFSSCLREEREKWIRLKYEQKAFLPPLPLKDIAIHQVRMCFRLLIFIN